MTVLLVLLTAIVFLTIDYFYSRRHQVEATVVALPEESTPPRLRPGIVEGFEVPANLRYHPGHTWALCESPNLVRVGIDQFAARLIGKVESLGLPQRGQWVRQGQKIWSIRRNGAAAELISPIEGMVTEINEDVLKNPELARQDPYGEGWLMLVQSPDAKTNFKNLLGGAVARRWMEEAAQRLRGLMPVPAGAVAQDGGVVVEDVATSLPDQDWKELTREFFLS